MDRKDVMAVVGTERIVEEEVTIAADWN